MYVCMGIWWYGCCVAAIPFTYQYPHVPCFMQPITHVPIHHHKLNFKGTHIYGLSRGVRLRETREGEAGETMRRVGLGEGERERWRWRGMCEVCVRKMGERCERERHLIMNHQLHHTRLGGPSPSTHFSPHLVAKLFHVFVKL